VEAAGIEPASESTLPLALHVYPTVHLTTLPPNGRGCKVAVLWVLAPSIQAYKVAILWSMTPDVPQFPKEPSWHKHLLVGRQ